MAAPKNLLAGSSAEAWQVRPAGPATVEQLPGGRERWVQVYRLDPYVPGDAVPVAFAPFEVAAGGGAASNQEIAPQNVRVETSLKNPKAIDARPITGIEELPPVTASGEWPVGIVLAAVIAAILAAVLLIVRRHRRIPPPLTASAWADREFTSLERDLAAETIAPTAVAERLAGVVRGYVERRYGVPATRRTTAELATVQEAPEEILDRVEAVRAILDRCDLAKFAGQEPTAEECRELLNAARALIPASNGDAVTK